VNLPWKRKSSPQIPPPGPVAGNEPADPPGTSRGRWTATFLLAGSAVMGATALAVWNRRAILDMRAQIDALASERREADGEEEIV
jgi:hypothetical protein